MIMSTCMQQCARHLRITKALYSLLTWGCLRSQERLPPFRFVVNETSSDRRTPTAPPEAFRYRWGWAAALINLRWFTVVSLGPSKALWKHSCFFMGIYLPSGMESCDCGQKEPGTQGLGHCPACTRYRVLPPFQWKCLNQLGFRIMVIAELKDDSGCKYQYLPKQFGFLIWRDLFTLDWLLYIGMIWLTEI